MELDEIRKELIKIRPNSPGWKNKIDTMDARDVRILYNDIKSKRKQGET